MASSFVNYKEKGFWVNDNLLIIVAHYLFKEYNNRNELEDWEKEFKGVIKDNASGYFVGFMDFDFDLYLINQSRINTFIELINLTKENIYLKGQYISPEELNSIDVIEDVKIHWTESIESKRFIKILDFIKDLIQGNLTCSASDEINYIF